MLQEKIRRHPQFEIHTNTDVREFVKGENGKLAAIRAVDRESGEELEWMPAGAFVFIGLDPNTAFLRGVLDLDEPLKALGVVHHFAVFEGVHQWPPKEIATRALAWFDLQAMKAGLREKDPAWIDRQWEEALGRAPAGSVRARRSSRSRSPAAPRRMRNATSRRREPARNRSAGSTRRGT